MQSFVNAPHRGDNPKATPVSPNAALLIDFDNVTMGIRSDLTNQLKDLLNSDIIKGKVAVQRAYADWRRYAQYIVPLSEASVDLIFAPAYGSSKKNATDIRLAIDALELVFTRPEIGVYILLSGDSDFSSLVLKLKEYGKYVIGVGLRESASDLLVQNCDEYYSYSGLTGLTKAGDEDTVSEQDPWELVEAAVLKMADQNDVMRSDRLKQVMLDLDPNFDEGEIGYSKFNKFLVEAASRNKLALKKLDNGQYEVQPFASDGGARRAQDDGRGRREERRRSKPEPRQRERREQKRDEPRASKPAPEPKTKERRGEDLDHAYELLKKAVRQLIDDSGDAARDSDIKRQMLELESGWDESELGFTKFTRFLRQAHDAEVIDLQRTSEGYYLARIPGEGPRPSSDRRPSRRQDRGRRDRSRQERKREPRAEEKELEPGAEEQEPEPEPEDEAAVAEEKQPEQPEHIVAEAEAGGTEEPAGAPAPETTVEATSEEPSAPSTAEAEARPAPKTPSYGRRARRGKASDGPPPLLPGQVVGGAASTDDRADVEVAASAPEESHGNEREDEDEAPTAEPTMQAEPSPSEEEAEPQQAPARQAPPPPAFDPEELGLPTEEGAVIRYLSNSYQGVGQKTAEALIEEFGSQGVFNGLNSQPDKVKEILGAGRRTELLLEAWQRDYRRRAQGAEDKQPVGDTA